MVTKYVAPVGTQPSQAASQVALLAAAMEATTVWEHMERSWSASAEQHVSPSTNLISDLKSNVQAAHLETVRCTWAHNLWLCSLARRCVQA